MAQGKYDGEGNLHRYRGESIYGTDTHYLSVQQQMLNYKLIYLILEYQYRSTTKPGGNLWTQDDSNPVILFICWPE